MLSQSILQKILNFVFRKQSDGLSLETTGLKRKVRAAQGIPLPNIEAIREG